MAKAVSYINRVAYLDVPIYQPIQLDIVVILAEWIDQHLGNFQPSDVKTKLQRTYAACVNYV